MRALTRVRQIPCVSWKDKKLLVDNLVFFRSGMRDDAAIKTAMALSRAGATICVVRRPNGSHTYRHGRPGAWRRSKGRLFVLTDSNHDGAGMRGDAVEEAFGMETGDCAVVSRFSSGHLPSAQSTGAVMVSHERTTDEVKMPDAVTIIASGDFPFWQVALYLKTFLHFGNGDFAGGYDALKPSLIRDGKEYRCFRTDTSLDIYLYFASPKTIYS